MELLERLKKIRNRYDQVNELLSDSAVISEMEKMINLSRERSELEEIVTASENYEKILNDIEGNKEIINSKTDKELIELAEFELLELEEKKESMEEEIKLLIMPRDPNDNKSIIMEIRAGTGG
ncbi:MAG: PCRF domain-containing protein, partial [Ignavibacteria bacterium]|nr:PCRF domain-containing protein [Ignavibacteria bacterium]